MHAAAESNLKKLIYAVLAIALVIAAASFWPPFAQGYEIKTACHLSCNDFIKAKRFPGSVTKDPAIDFIAAATRAGVRLTPEQFTIDAKENVQERSWTCNCKVKYPAKVEWAFVGDILALKKFIWPRSIHVEHTVANSY